MSALELGDSDDVSNMFATWFLPHVVYSVAITSVSIHLVYQRKISNDERAQINAQISILESISQQLQSNKSLSDNELERLKRLAYPVKDREYSVAGILKEEIRWKDVILGRKRSDGVADSTDWDKKDIQKGSSTLPPHSIYFANPSVSSARNREITLMQIIYCPCVSFEGLWLCKITSFRCLHADVVPEMLSSYIMSVSTIVIISE